LLLNAETETLLS